MPRSSSLLRPSAGILLILALAGLAGCKDRSMVVYRVPKEAILPGAGAPAASPTVASAAPGIHWEAPAGWQVQKADGLRAGSFLVTGADGAKADVSVVTFSGTGGEDLANVNRWRGQVQLDPFGPAELAAQLQAIAVPAGTISFLDLSGTTGDAKTPARLLGAWFRSPERVWFFKMLGAASVVAAQREAFLGFLRTVTLTTAAPEAAAPALPMAGNGAGSIPPPPGDVPLLRWHAPADWQVKPASAMRKGSYAVGDAEVAITVFPGDVGGVLANVNRWRGQVGLNPVDEAGLDGVTTQLTSNGFHFIATDVTGTAAGAPRIVAVLVPWQGHTWFFKLTGPDAAVGQAKPAFLDFLLTVEAP